MRLRTSLLFLTLSLLLVTPAFSTSPALSAAASTFVTDDQPTLNFPDSITFQATIESSASITSVILEYGTHQLTCGTVLAKAFPHFTPGASVTPEWTWEMKQSGSLPPGASLWWRWRYTDENGIENVSDKKTLTWLDSDHDWQTITSGPIYLHWYSGDRAFANELLNAGVAGLTRLKNDAGLQPDQPIHLYIYANTDDMKDAILYEPTWTGGLAYADHDIVIIGISQRDLEWGRTTIAHELTHVLVGHLTFSCLGDVPTWLNEGLAVYSEGQLDPAAETQLDDAIQTDQLLSVRSLSGGFSEVPSRAYLSYSQSYSIVKFLIETYGQDQMNSLLITLRDGTTIDEAVLHVYGFDVDGLENAWRESVGATLKTASALPTVQPTPTFVPTYVPFAGAPVVVTSTPYAIPTSSSAEPTPQSGGPPIALTLILAAVGCSLVLLIGVLALGAYLASERRKGGGDEPGA
ncbi:MAG: peptidase MA family metallohydrolase [Anaerolineales bacterium]